MKLDTETDLFEVVPIFNISSAGCAGTNWLSRIINFHPHAACFHSVRADPFLYSDDMGNPVKWMTPSQAVDGLMMLHKCASGTKSVGVCHVFYGSDVKPYFLNAKSGSLTGTHSVIFRNLLQRMHSALCLHSADIVGQSAVGGGLYQMLSKYPVSNEINFDENGNLIGAQPHEAKFLDIARQIILYDIQNYQMASPDEILLFEKMTKDTGYLIEKIERLIGCDASCLESVIEKNKERPRHHHSKGEKLSDEEIFFSWPKSYQHLMAIVMSGFGVNNSFQMYRDLGYEIPEPVSSALFKY